MIWPLVANYPDQLTERFRLQILSGQLAPGERLREEALAKQFGVSRGPIRDAFVRLTKEGLLEARPNAGVRVAAPPSDFKRRSLVQVRRTLECNALREWFSRGRADLLETLDQNLAMYHKACRREALEEVVVLDMAFHHAVVGAVDGGSLLETWQPVTAQMFLRYSRHQSLLESHTEHAAIVKAMHAKDRAAVRLLREHIV